MGLWRVGSASAGQVLQEHPDVAVYGGGSMLTSGYASLSAILSTEEAFAANHRSPVSASCTGGIDSGSSCSPIPCAAALETLRLLDTAPFVQQHQKKQQQTVSTDGTTNSTDSSVPAGNNAGLFYEQELRDVSMLPGVKCAMALGTVLSIELASSSAVVPAGSVVSGSNNSNTANTSVAVVVALLRQERIAAVPVGSATLYFALTPLTSSADRLRLLRVLNRCLTKAYYSR